MKGIWTERAGMSDSLGFQNEELWEWNKNLGEGQISSGMVCIYDNQTASVSILFTKI
jgi:hypothetical protein